MTTTPERTAVDGYGLVAERPPAGPPRPYRFPEVLRREVEGGHVVAAHLPGQRLAVARLLLAAGGWREPAGREGLAGVVVRALHEGTTGRDAAAFALALESLGTSLSTAVDWDTLRVGVSVPADALEPAVALLAEAVRTPRLAEPDVVRVRDDARTAREMAWANPGPRAEVTLRATVFGTDIRYGRPLHGSPSSLATIEPDDVTAFHREWLSRPGTLVVAGDLDRVDLDRLAAAAFAGTRPADRPSPDDPITAPPGHRRVVLVSRPGAVQSYLAVGHAAPHRAHPDHVPMQLAGTVLGGAFLSRLNLLIREVRGYTYGIRADFAQSRRAGLLGVYGSVHTEVTAPAMADALGEIARTQRDGVTPEELESARHYRAGSLSVQMQTPAAIASALATLVVHDLPDDYYPALRERLLTVSLDEVNAAAAAHLRADRLTMAVEGDLAAVRADLTGAGLGEVVEADI